MIKLFVNGLETDIKMSTFKGGEEFVESYQSLQRADTVGIYAYIRSSQDLMRLFSLLQLCEESSCKTYLHLPYLPYARQDRKMNEIQPCQSNMICKMLGVFNLEEVRIDDPHSKASYGHLHNVKVTDQSELLIHEYRARFTFISDGDIILAPDKGAVNRCKSVAKAFNLPLAYCDKKRNLNTGEIIETVVPDNLTGKNIVIVDDIIDGGRTFINIAEKITDAKSLQLVCTHGIFSYGKDILLKHFNRVEAVYDWTKF